MMDTVLLLLTLLGMMAILYITLFGFLARRMQSEAREVLASLPGQTVVLASPNANFFGQESKGLAQWRGNGILVLTDQQLYFRRMAPRADWRLPLSAITGVDTPREHLAKVSAKPLLRVHYTNEQGQPDSLAWQVPNLDTWTQKLREAQ